MSATIDNVRKEIANEVHPIWVRPLGIAWRIRVDHEEFGRRLRNRLLEEKYICDELKPSRDKRTFSFQVKASKDRRQKSLNVILKEFSGGQLMTNPA